MIWDEAGVLNSLLTIQTRSQGQGNVTRMFLSLPFPGDFGNYQTIVVFVPLRFQRLRSFPPSTFFLSTTSRSNHIYTFFNQSYPTTAMSSIHIVVSTPTTTCWQKIQQVLTLKKVLPPRFVGDQRTSAEASSERLINRTLCQLAENLTLVTWDFLRGPTRLIFTPLLTVQDVLRHCVMQSNNTALNRTWE